MPGALTLIAAASLLSFIALLAATTTTTTTTTTHQDSQNHRRFLAVQPQAAASADCFGSMYGSPPHRPVALRWPEVGLWMDGKGAVTIADRTTCQWVGDWAVRIPQVTIRILDDGVICIHRLHQE